MFLLKRLWIAFGLIVAIFTVYVLETRTTDKVCADISYDLEIVKSYVENKEYTKALDYSEHIVDSWDRNHKLLSLFLIHEDLDDIDQSIEVLPVKLKNQDYSDFLSELSKIKTEVNSIKDNEDLTIENVI